MSSTLKMVTEIMVAPELWSTALLPEGILEQWLLDDGSRVRGGDPIASVRIEDALHEVMAPCNGRLSIAMKANSVVDPGVVIGAITREVQAP
jgi:pyruvate/2-oxoglutarate dehydrogenase complex dihydrolipoamide acyltransferase (E2) component